MKQGLKGSFNPFIKSFKFNFSLKFDEILGCVWIKDLVMEMEMEMEKVGDPMVPNGWIFLTFLFPFLSPHHIHSLRLCLDQGFGEGKGKGNGKVMGSNRPESLDPLTFSFPFPTTKSLIQTQT